MQKIKQFLKKYKHIRRLAQLKYTINRWSRQFFDFSKPIKAIPRFIGYFNDLQKYKKLPNAEKINFIDTYPCIHEKTATSGFDSHYFYQSAWAYKKIYDSKTEEHYDIGSWIIYVGLLSIVTKVNFVDLRPIKTQLNNLIPTKGDILNLPYDDNSIFSISCLNVAEHIGLGRYGDQLDPLGTKKACKELARILKPGGNLYFSVPIGQPRVYFNGYRSHTIDQILDYFNNLKLIELSAVDDNKNYLINIDKSILKDSNYSLGLFHFTK